VLVQLTEGDIFDAGDDGSLGRETIEVECSHYMNGGEMNGWR
jgi:hypothetical protein